MASSPKKRDRKDILSDAEDQQPPIKRRKSSRLNQDLKNDEETVSEYMNESEISSLNSSDSAEFFADDDDSYDDDSYDDESESEDDDIAHHKKKSVKQSAA